MTLGREDFIEMLTYARPEGSKAQKSFCKRYLEPVAGKPDKHGNYIKHVGKNPTVAFMSHHDTVHHEDGRVSVRYPNTQAGSFAYAHGGSCLGADCTTGVYIMLKMIEASVPGVYVFHAGEEIGCVGSSKIAYDQPMWLSSIKFAISFDRKGYNSIITHQMGSRCCSDAFVSSLNTILGGGYFGDSSGVYTDSNEYIGLVSECTNLSVGYFNQHTKKEYQDLDFLDDLVKALVSADWSKLVSERVPVKIESYYPVGDKNTTKTTKKKTSYEPMLAEGGWSNYGWEDYADEKDYGGVVTDLLEKEGLTSVIKKYPEEVAEILLSFGYNSSGLQDDCDDIAIKNRKSYGRGY